MNKSANMALLGSAYQYYLLNQTEHQHSDDYASLSKITAQFEVISFDIFDTILTRLFECPIDVFAFVQGILEEKGHILEEFAIKRLEAEESARHIAQQTENREEITLAEIYQQLATYFPDQSNALQLAYQTELETEFNSIVPVGEIKYLMQQLLKQNKKIIFVSDIYLDKSFIQSLLEKNGLALYDELYVSSDLMRTKHSGHIWKTVLANNPDRSILHIGDNMHADVEMPKKYAIATFYYQPLRSERRFGAQLSTDIVPFSLMSKISLLLENNSQQPDAEHRFWFRLGETLGALILKSFVDWLYQEAQKNNIQHIYFCARDSQLIQTVWNQLGYGKQAEISSSYLYVSRNLLRFPNCYLEIMETGQLSDASLEFLVPHSLQFGDRYQDYFKRLGLSNSDVLKAGFANKFGGLEQAVDFKRMSELKDFLQQQLLPALMPIFKTRYENVLNYYEQEGVFDEQKNIAIVDLGWSGTIQMALADFSRLKGIKRKIYGYYYGLFNDAAAGRLYKNGPMKAAFFNLFWTQNELCLPYNAINILENLHSANHETVIDVAFNNQSNRYEAVLKSDVGGQYILRFNQTFKIFQQGILHSIQQWQNNNYVYGISSTDVSRASALAAIAQICISPNQSECLYLGQIQHAPLHDHVIFYPLVEKQLPHNKQEIDKLFCLNMWPCGQMANWRHRKKEWNPNLYEVAAGYFNYFPDFIKKHLIY